MVIVTQNQYILAQKICHVTMDERKEYIDIRTSNGKSVTTVQRSFVITILYQPEQSSNSHGGSAHMTTCEVTILTKQNAYKVYRDLIGQIREQMPDQLFLDKALENLLGGEGAELPDVHSIPLRDEYELAEYKMEKTSDRKSKKASKPRKTKRSNKKVLRKSR